MPCAGNAMRITTDGSYQLPVTLTVCRRITNTTGISATSEKQLYIYVALFCLEYKIKPSEIEIECRIYQNDEVAEFHPTAEDIVPIMDKIISFDKILKKMDMEVAM